MARVCVIRQHYVPRDTRVAREVEALVKRGHQVDVICLRDKGERWHASCDGVTFWRVPLRHTRGRKLLRYLAEYGLFFAATVVLLSVLHVGRRYRLVQVNAPPDVLVFSSIVPRALGAQVLLDLQECMPEFFATKFGTTAGHPVTRLIAVLEQLSIRHASFVITPTAQMRETFVSRGADAAKIDVVTDGADEETFRDLGPGTAVVDKTQAFRLVSHGTIEEHYGLDTVVEAVARLRDDIPELRLDIYGDGSALPALRRLVDDLGVADRVWFSGRFVPLDELVRGLAAADVGVVALRRDPFRDVSLPGKVFDFVAMRKPVIASRTRSMDETFGGSAVELFDAGDAADLARAVWRLYVDPARARELVERATELAEPYQWRRQREVYASVVERLLRA